MQLYGTIFTDGPIVVKSVTGIGHPTRLNLDDRLSILLTRPQSDALCFALLALVPPTKLAEHLDTAPAASSDAFVDWLRRLGTAIGETRAKAQQS